MWRGSGRFCLSVSAPFVWRCPNSRNLNLVSTPLSSNRTGGATASGSRTRHQTFVHGRSYPTGQAIVRARFNSTRTRSPQTCHNREHHRLGDDRFPDKCPGSSFTSACGAFRSSRNLNGVYRVSPISCTLPLSVPTLN